MTSFDFATPCNPDHAELGKCEAALDSFLTSVSGRGHEEHSSELQFRHHMDTIELDTTNSKGSLQDPKGWKMHREFVKVQLQGHRAFGDLAPHNSKLAFQLATQSPFSVDSVEFDVRCTKDDVLVVTHGPEMANEKCDIEDTNWGQVKQMKIPCDGVWVQPDFFDLSAMAQQTIPCLSEVIDICLEGNVHMNVELKEGKEMSYEKEQNFVLKVIEMLRMKKVQAKQAKISSFSGRILQHVRNLAPEIPIAALYNNYLEPGMCAPTPDNFAEYVSIDPIMKSDSDCEPLPKLWLRPHMDAVHLCGATMQEEHVKKAHRSGVAVLAWFSAVPDPAENEKTFALMEKWGVDTICTNRPDQFYCPEWRDTVSTSRYAIPEPVGST